MAERDFVFCISLSPCHREDSGFCSHQDLANAPDFLSFDLFTFNPTRSELLFPLLFFDVWPSFQLLSLFVSVHFESPAALLPFPGGSGALPTLRATREPWALSVATRHLPADTRGLAGWRGRG